MTQGIDQVTTQLLGMALDVATLRHQVHATNLANASTPGYAAHRVSFESEMDSARRTLQVDGTLTPADLTAARASVHPMVDSRGLPVSVQLDTEVADMSRNAVQYQALTRGLSRHLSLLAMAATEGKK